VRWNDSAVTSFGRRFVCLSLALALASLGLDATVGASIACRIRRSITMQHVACLSAQVDPALPLGGQMLAPKQTVA
jgi:hypothetical protein